MITLIIPDASFLEALKAAVRRTSDFVAQNTEYHGGRVGTEYILTADIARELVHRGFHVAVECLNWKLLNAMNLRKGIKPREFLGSQRTDVAVLDPSGLIPRAMIEVKIGLRRFSRRLRDDLRKITGTLALMEARDAARVIGAVVFEVHIPGTQKRTVTADFKTAAHRVENELAAQLKSFASSLSDFSFAMYALQSPEGGLVPQEIDWEQGEAVLGALGHATRYHAILVRSIRPVVGLSALPALKLPSRVKGGPEKSCDAADRT